MFCLAVSAQAEFTAPTRPPPIVQASLPDPYAEEAAAAIDDACQVFPESKTLEPNESVQLSLRMKAVTCKRADGLD